MKQLLSFSLFCSTMAVAPLAHSSTVVVPGEFADLEGTAGGENTALGNFSNTVQVVYNESVLLSSGLQVGDVLNGLAFRVGAAGNPARVSPNFSVDNYIIRLSTSLNSAGDLADVFASNRGTDFTEVRSGALTFNAADFDDTSTAPGSGPGTPNAFGSVITFDNTFTYNGGDLLLEYTHNLDTDVDTTAITSGADALNDFNDDSGAPLVETLFGAGFDVTTRTFSPAPGFAPVVQFSVVPEPSTGILSGMGLLGLLLRRRR